MEQNRKKKLALIGCSGAGKLIRSALDGLGDEAALCAVCDLNEERGKGFGVPIYTDYKKMLDECDIDAVIIATPPYESCDIMRECVSRGISFAAEEPSASDPDECGEIFAQAREKNVKCAVLSRVLTRSVRVMKCYCEKYPVISASFEVRGTLPDKFWKRERELCGGIITEKGVGAVSVMRSLFGEPRETFGCLSSGYLSGQADYFTDDEYNAVMSFECGVTAHMRLTNCEIRDGGMKITLNSYGKRLEYTEIGGMAEIRIFGEKFDPGKSRKLLRAGEILPDSWYFAENGNDTDFVEYRINETAEEIKSFIDSDAESLRAAESAADVRFAIYLTETARK